MEQLITLYITLHNVHLPTKPSDQPGIHLYSDKGVTALQSVGDKYNVTFGLDNGVPFHKVDDGKRVIVQKADKSVTVSPALNFMANLFHLNLISVANPQPTLKVLDSPNGGTRVDTIQPAQGGSNVQ